MSLYIYAFTDRSVPVTREGLDGAEISWIDGESIAVAVSAAPSGTIRPRRKLLAAHQGVVAEIASQTDTLPAAFGLVCDERDHLETLIESERDAVLTQLRRVGGCVEMSLSVGWDVENPFAHMRELDEELRELGDELARLGDGAPHALKVRVGRRVERLLHDRHLHIAELFDASVAPHCREITTREGAAETELFGATMLVGRDEIASLESGVEELARELDESYVIGFKGPFAPHSFVDLQLSFDGAVV
ncbi:MAG: hypothetical protein Tsb0013_14790 [Phycisphaerales bacterium]